MNKIERLLVAAVFRTAKSALWDGSKKYYGSAFICIAITRTHPHHIPRYATTLAKEIISGRINGYYTLDAYLKDGLKISQHSLTARNVQVFRHLWLDSLIQEFSA